MIVEEILKKLGELPITGKWIWLHTNRHGKERMTELVKDRIETHGDLEINDEYTKFRRIESCKQLLERIDNPKGAFFTIEWHDQKEVEFNYDHLPEAQLKTYSSKEWDKKKGRV